MPVRKAHARWNDTLKAGNGIMRLGTGAFEGAYSFASRFEEGEGTNPEELIGAAHAGCFSMAFSLALEQAGYPPEHIETEARVHLDKAGEGFRITRVVLDTRGAVAGIGEQEFLAIAEQAKAGCPVSQALTGVEVELHAQLAS